MINITITKEEIDDEIVAYATIDGEWIKKFKLEFHKKTINHYYIQKVLGGYKAEFKYFLDAWIISKVLEKINENNSFS